MMKQIVSKNFKQSLAGLKRHNLQYFAKHPEEVWRYVKLIAPDRKSWAIVKLKNPFIV